MGPEASGGTSDFKLNTHSMPHLSLVLPLCLTHTHACGRDAAETIGEKGMASKKQLPVTSEAKPVLAPSATPAVDSAKVLTVETPSTEPTFETDWPSQYTAYGLGLGPIGFGDGATDPH